MKNRKSILFWLLGATILFAVLYFFILRYPGYIFYFDSSGSFNYNRPFDQYLFTYTPYDGIEVGIKNRLPLVSIIAGLYYLLAPLLHLSAQDVIKIAFVLIFLGAYTAFYLILPRFYALLWKEKVKNELFESNTGRMLRVVFSLLYLMVPFFVFRLTMMSMFFFTTFYPLITYVFLQLCEKRIFSWRSILLLVILCFFGFSYTNIIPYYILTFGVFAVAAFVSKKSQTQRVILLRNLVVAGLLVIVTNVYWIVPYFLKGNPEPGYTVTSMMVDALGNKSTFQNVLLDTSEWFVGQGEKAVVFLDQNKLLSAIQILGAINVYLFAIFALKSSKKKSYAMVIAFLIITAFFAVVQGSPLYSYLYNHFVYFDFGWLIREPNRQRFFIAFWTFLLFALGMITLSKKDEKDTTHQDGFVRLSVLVAFVTYLVYVTPWAYNTLLFLKPTVINSDLAQVNSELSQSKGYSFVNTLPSLELYRTAWIDKKYDIADIWNYRLNYYSLGRPPLQLNTVVPVARTRESLINEMLFWQGDADKTARILKYLGTEYTLFDKQAIPLFTSNPDNKKYYIDPIKELYIGNKNWETTYSGENYILSRNTSYSNIDSLSLTRETVVTAEPLEIITQLSASSLIGRDIKFMFKDVSDLGPADTILVTKGDENFFMDYIYSADRTKYTTYPFDYTVKYGIPVDWGRASSQDKGGAEFTSVLRYHGIRAYQLLQEDKIAYSDKDIKDASQWTSLKYVIDTPCQDNCSIYAKVMFSTQGGELSISAGNAINQVQTKSTNKEGFYWEKIATGVSFVNTKIEMEIINKKGFNALGGIVILPDTLVNTTMQRLSQRTVYEVSESKNGIELPDINPNCSIDKFEYANTIIPHVSVSGFCDHEVAMKLKQFQSEFLYVNKQTGKSQFVNSINVLENFEGEIWFFSKTDVTLWMLFGVTYLGIIISAELILLKHVR